MPSLWIKPYRTAYVPAAAPTPFVSPILLTFAVSNPPVSLTVGDTWQPVITSESWQPGTAEPTGTTDYEYSSSNAAVFTVNASTGLVTAAGNGSAHLIVQETISQLIVDQVVAVIVQASPTPAVIDWQIAANIVAVQLPSSTATVSPIIRDALGNHLPTFDALQTFDTDDHSKTTCTAGPSASTIVTPVATGGTPHLVSTLTGSFGTITSTISVNVLAAASGGGADPFEPGSLVPMVVTAFTDHLPPKSSYTTTVGITTGHYMQVGNPSGSESLGATASDNDPNSLQPPDYGRPKRVTSSVTPVIGAPTSAYCASVLIPQGMKGGGSGEGVYNFWSTVAGARTTLFERAIWRTRSSDFEMQLATTKMMGYWYLSVAGPAASHVMILKRHGTNLTEIVSQFQFEFELSVPGHGTRNMAQNLNLSKFMACGSFTTIRTLLIANTVDIPNGIIRLWIDGTQTHEYTNVLFVTSANPTAFCLRHWDLVWGGSAGPNKSRDDIIDIDSMYISGA